MENNNVGFVRHFNITDSGRETCEQLDFGGRVSDVEVLLRELEKEISYHTTLNV
jgi:hypothetical protein